MTLLLALACHDPDPVVPDSGTFPEPPTGETGVEPPALTASCAADPANVLRYTCQVHVSPPQPVELTVADGAGARPEQVFGSAEVASDHLVHAWFLTAQTPYQWTVTALDTGETAEGQWFTGALPAGTNAPLVTFSGSSTARKIGYLSPCTDGAYVLVADPSDGAVVWYEDVALGPFGLLGGASFTEDRTVIAVVDGGLVEVDLAGDRRLELYPGTQFPGYSHHDVFRRDGLTYALFEEVVHLDWGQYKLDGFFVFDAAGEVVGEWHLADWFLPPDDGTDDLGNVEDYSHANAIWVDAAGRVTVSFRHLSAYVVVDGDPDSPRFGAVVDSVGSTNSPVPSATALTPGALDPFDFQRQHNVHWLDETHLTLFDNRFPGLDNSRVLELELDPAAGTVVATRAWELPRQCDYQGSAWRTAAGNPLATCGPTGEGWEFDLDDATVVWSGQPQCATGLTVGVPRLVPLEW
ncbi:MAG: aryl-sulfate sulfotransferase [Myxococcota bacterium]